MTFVDAYYHVKPFIPRRLQIAARGIMALRKLRIVQDAWPIDREANRRPGRLKEWPGQKKFALNLNHDVDTAKGHSQCLKLMEIERLSGFRSPFYFVPEGYPVSPDYRWRLAEAGFEVGVHGLVHDGKTFRSRRIFDERVPHINRYLKEWGAVGFSSPSMLRNLDWIINLDSKYDISTFDTDSFEPQPGRIGTIYPFWNAIRSGTKGNVELPCPLPQDHTLFIILKKKDIGIWKMKLDWIAEHAGMSYSPKSGQGG